MSYDTGLSMEERVTSLFQPDTLLPDQYLDTFRRKLHLEPEKKLMLAILEDAIACFQKYVFAHDVKGKALFHEALGQAPAERSAFVAQAVGGDDSLAEEVLGLLAEEAKSGLAAVVPPNAGATGFFRQD